MLCDDKLPHHTSHATDYACSVKSPLPRHLLCAKDFVYQGPFVHFFFIVCVFLRLSTCHPPYDSDNGILEVYEALHRWGPFNMTWLRFFDSLPHR